MSLTENNYTGNGSTVLYSFTFPYLGTSDIKVSVNDVNTTQYTLDNATTVRFNTAPAINAKIRIYRATDNQTLRATFYSGSAIRAEDLNDNFTQILYRSQESGQEAENAIALATTAINTVSTATSTANQALNEANAAKSTAAAAETKADNATTTANNANNTANAALSAVASSVQYVLLANVAAIPSSPTDGYAIEVANSTGIESFSPVVNRPVGFVGDPGLSVRLQYSVNDGAWNWLNYSPNDPDSRYITEARADNKYMTSASADAKYLTSSAAASTYLTPGAADSKYLTPAQGDVRYAPYGSTGGGGSGTVNDATTTTKGIVQLADSAAISAGTAGRVVDAAQLKANVPNINNASDSIRGIVMLATSADVSNGVDSSKAVTPSVVKAFLDTKANASNVYNKSEVYTQSEVISSFLPRNISSLPLLP